MIKFLNACMFSVAVLSSFSAHCMENPNVRLVQILNLSKQISRIIVDGRERVDLRGFNCGWPVPKFVLDMADEWKNTQIKILTVQGMFSLELMPTVPPSKVMTFLLHRYDGLTQTKGVRGLDDMVTVLIDQCGNVNFEESAKL
jgi:hypothetical protein